MTILSGLEVESDTPTDVPPLQTQSTNLCLGVQSKSRLPRKYPCCPLVLSVNGSLGSRRPALRNRKGLFDKVTQEGPSLPFVSSLWSRRLWRTPTKRDCPAADGRGSLSEPGFLISSGTSGLGFSRSTSKRFTQGVRDT